MVIVKLGYKKIVLSEKDAIVLAEILSKAEMYDSVYQPDAPEGEDPYTHHIWGCKETWVDMHVMPEALYRIAKLAGKPTP